ncbi:MAG: hypothetical protein WAM94_01570 [Chromatiaceae bacterium]
MSEMTTSKLFVVAFLAVLLANLATLAVVRMWMEHEARELALALGAQTGRFTAELDTQAQAFQADLGRRMEERTVRSEEHRKAMERVAAQQHLIQDELDRKAQTQRDRVANAARIKQETCETWRRFYAKEKTEFNRTMMKQSCP